MKLSQAKSNAIRDNRTSNFTVNTENSYMNENTTIN